MSRPVTHAAEEESAGVATPTRDTPSSGDAQRSAQDASSSAWAAQPRSARRMALRGDLLDFTADPGWTLPARHLPSGARFRQDHWLLVEDGRIHDVLPPLEQGPPGWPVHDHRGRLIMPGFIDTHVHASQLDVIAAFGAQLLDWLEHHTFPAEQAHADPAVAHAGAEHFVQALLASGTTAAMVFPTVHRHSVHSLFEVAQSRNMRLITGKVLMDRHAPPALLDDVAGARTDCEDLIKRWHGQGRLAYAVTPRFAATSTPEQLAMAGRLCADHPGLYMQTHVAENLAEVRWMAELYPQARSYLDIYAQHGLLHDKAVLAHGIWLDAADRAALRDSGASIAFCPSSNLFLGSGLFDWPAMLRDGVAVSLASDVGGGTSLCMLRTLADAYKVQALRGSTDRLSGPQGTAPDEVPKLNAWQGLYSVTLGAASVLGLSAEIGSLAQHRMADVAIWDWAVGPVAGHRHEVIARGVRARPSEEALAQGLHAQLFAWMTLGDERNLCETWVAGQRQYQRPDAAIRSEPRC